MRYLRGLFHCRAIPSFKWMNLHQRPSLFKTERMKYKGIASNNRIPNSIMVPNLSKTGESKLFSRSSKNGMIVDMTGLIEIKLNSDNSIMNLKYN